MEEWRIDRTGGRCVKTGRAFAEGETYHTVLYEEGDEFRREDFSTEAWSGPPEGSFCHFKSHMPVKEKKKRLLVDDDVLIEFFTRLEAEKARVRRQFRFVLALILMRKRLLKYEETRREGEDEFWQMRLAKDQSLHAVLNPKLTDDEIEEVSRQLGAVLHGDMGDFSDGESEVDKRASVAEAAEG